MKYKTLEQRNLSLPYGAAKSEGHRLGVVKPCTFQIEKLSLDQLLRDKLLSLK